MINCALVKENVSAEKCMYCDYCKGSYKEENRTITFCTFSKADR